MTHSYIIHHSTHPVPCSSSSSPPPPPRGSEAIHLSLVLFFFFNSFLVLEFDNTKNALSRGATAPTTTTTITITITLPTGLAKFSHFWIMVMRVNNSLANQIGAGSLQPFSSNVSFVNYSSSLPVGAPYVAAELPGDSPSSFNYTLGDETQQNDAPLVHPNRGLMPGTMYTVFVWGFFNLMVRVEANGLE